MSTRWLLKKSARRAVALASWASGSLAGRDWLDSTPRIRAITYHRFGDTPQDPYCVSTAAFARQMRWLADAGRLVSLDDVSAFVAGHRRLPANGVLVTIDDGCRSLYTEALPILRDLAVPAVAFVSAGLVGEAAVATDHGEPYASWDELARVRDGGVEVGSHAFDHRSLGRMTGEAAREQAEKSRARIEQRLGKPARSFAYPFGTRADFSAATDRVLAESGYEIAFNSVHGTIRPGMQGCSLPRVKVEGGEGQRMFELTCRGGMDAWRLMDDVLWRILQTRSETSSQG